MGDDVVEFASEVCPFLLTDPFLIRSTPSFDLGCPLLSHDGKSSIAGDRASDQNADGTVEPDERDGERFGVARRVPDRGPANEQSEHDECGDQTSAATSDHCGIEQDRHCQHGFSEPDRPHDGLHHECERKHDRPEPTPDHE